MYGVTQQFGAGIGNSCRLFPVFRTLPPGFLAISEREDDGQEA